MRPIDLIVIHCSDTPNGRWTTVEDIDLWHRDRGFHRDPSAQSRFNPALTSIGYHFAIYANGALATGRGIEEIGAHASGWNQRSIGICMVGRDGFSAPQWAQLRDQVQYLAQRFKVPLSTPRFDVPGVPRGICGHRELPAVSKTCPGFAVADWLAGGMAPLTSQTCAPGAAK